MAAMTKACMSVSRPIIASRRAKAIDFQGTWWVFLFKILLYTHTYTMNMLGKLFPEWLSDTVKVLSRGRFSFESYKFVRRSLKW